ncbi:EAL domain-containing protein [uncultured Jatrophihabitans sp.]|uniref:EAL domain-containing protein n=1 Tax=uncultured Jatrophihabitans sp. TaxID=1610747 RepID=UPI0035C9854D
MAPWLCVVLVVAAFVADLRLQPGGAFTTRAVDDLTQLATAAVAAIAGFRRARAGAGRLRLSWALIGAGAGCWAIGETIWSWYELVRQVESPFPSLADVGFLLFPACTAAGLMVRPSRAFAGRAKTRIVLDVVLVVISLFAISWATAFGQVYRGGGSDLATIVSLAYPAGDLALLAVVVIVLSYARAGGRTALVWVGVGLSGFAVADSGFAYLSATGSYQTGNLIDACWVAGFLVVAAATTTDADAVHDERQLAETPRAALLLPYLPAGVGVLAAALRLHDSPHDSVMLVTATVTVWLLIARQVIVLLDNRVLMSRVTHQALHDSLTGLGNRALFADRLQHALDRHSRDRRALRLVLIDLDDFKTVNDSLGHPAGDELLVQVSERLRAAIRSSDTLARLGGDEFAVLLEDAVLPEQGADSEMATDRLMSALALPVQVGRRLIPVSASVGVAVLQPADQPADAADMLRWADLAMYDAKRGGKSRMSLYSADLGESGGELDLRSALDADIAADRIDVAVQPIQLADGRQHGVEALARWCFRGAAVAPAAFLPAAAALGLAAALDDVVIAKSVVAAASWGDGRTLAVNVSGATLIDESFPRRLTRLLDRLEFAADRLVVELREDGLAAHDRAGASTIAGLRELGVRIAVDDFGARFADLGRLRALRPDIVKIDRTLVAAAADGAGAATLAAVAELARRFGAFVVAEGVETRSGLDAALAAGCDAAQGYLLGRPTALAELMVLSADGAGAGVGIGVGVA